MAIMKHLRKTWLIIPVVGLVGMIGGLVVSSNLNLSETGVAASSSQSTGTLNQLNADFIRISQQVTPAVVSIAMNKTIKHNPQNGGDAEDFFNRFFENPQGGGMPEQDQRQQGLGSGVIVDAEKGLILTNNHVVAEADEIKVTLTDRRVLNATIVGTDPKTDLAVIKLSGAKNLHAAKLGDSNRLEVGEWVLAIGNPFGLNSTVTAGIISAKGRANVGVADFEDFIQTDAAINPGNSGGALVNIQGEIIGINTAIATRSKGYMGIGFAIPSNMARQVMTALIEKGKVTRAQLGVFIRPMDDTLARSLGLTNSNQGIVVTGVVEGSPAEKAGLKKYDVIVKLQGKSVSETNQFRNEIALMPPGSNVTLDVLRDGKSLSFKVNLRELQTGSAVKPGITEDPTENRSLGFEAEGVTPDILKQLGLEPTLKGVVVTNISSTSPAYEKGLRRGDVITELNRKPIRSLQDFKTASAPLKKGDVVLLSVSKPDATVLVAFEVP